MANTEEKNFVIYRSSAGSGKTFTLVLEYLRLALHDPNKLSYHFKRILAITFTNKAAGEMKERIIQSLRHIVSDQQLPIMGHKLCEALLISEMELKERSQVLLNAILHNYSDLAIGTIDSFTHKIVKTFAHDLKLPVNFNIETDMDSFYHKVVQELLGKIGEDAHVTHVLKNFSLEKAEENDGWDPEKGILEFIKLFKTEDAPYYVEQLKGLTDDRLQKVKKSLRENQQQFEKELTEMANAAENIRISSGLNVGDFHYGTSGAYGLFLKCLEQNYEKIDTGSSRLTDAIHTNNWAPKRKDCNDQVSPPLSALAEKIIAYFEANYGKYIISSLLYKNIFQLMLVKEIDTISRERKLEETIVFISEFNQKIFELINNEPAPYIYERIGERYMHYLVDEFQDTSRLQWHNLLPLIDNSLANGWFNMIVGDGKQSIYRWRNADVKQFALLPELENPTGSPVIQERQRTLKRNHKDKELDKNFRSTSTVVGFNNELFEQLSTSLLHEDLKKIYHKQKQTPNNPASGYLTFHTGKMPGEELDDFHFLKTIEAIHAAVADGYHYRHICVLTRNNVNGSRIAEHLMKNNIPVVSSDSLLLKNNQEVNALVSFLSYLHNREDVISAAAVVNYLNYSGKLDPEKYTYGMRKLSERKTLFDVLDEIGIGLDPGDLLLKNLLDLCIDIAEKLDLNKNNHLYIRFFLDEVCEFLTSKNSSLGAFLLWWENRSDNASVIVQDNSNAVKIMTIHASKGLEFPIVIMPFCNWRVQRQDPSWVKIQEDSIDLPVSVVKLSKKVLQSSLGPQFEKEEAAQILDNLNLLYVAFTRAVDRLKVISVESDGNTFVTVNKWLDDYLKNIYDKNENGFYEIGNRTAPAKDHDTSKGSEYLIGELAFADLKNIIRIKPAFGGKDSEAENARRDGILLHQILSEIVTESDTEEVLHRYELSGRIDPELKEKIRSQIHSILQLPELQTYFKAGGEVKAEKEIITENSEILRPDRIFISDDHITILDYKTGERNDKKHALQLKKYEHALQQMGYTRIRKLLVYLQSGTVAEC